MPRFQLLIRELGKAPRVVPVTQTLVVGRSRRADVVIEDEEVSREQFRIGIAGASVFIEGIGKTNRTNVDGSTLEPGQKVTVNAGASIKIGRTVVQVQAGDATENALARPGSIDATMVAPGPAAGSQVDPSTLPEQEQTGGYRGPRGAVPPADATAPPADGPLGQTMDGKGAFRPGSAGPGTTPPRPPTEFGQTIDVKGSFRPGQRTPPPGPTTPPASTNPPDVTMKMPGGYRPGAEPAPRPPARDLRPTTPTSPSAPEPQRPQPAPLPTPLPTPRPAAPVPAMATPADAGDQPDAKPAAAVRPKTVLVNPLDLVASGGGTNLAAGDVETRLHQANPRLFVKGETIRRRVRLMKARTRIGRAETADVLLPNESVSELHAEIEFDGTTWALRDCGSTNGTLVDGTIVRSTSRPIARNALLGFGSLRGLFLVNDPATAADDRRHEERALRLLVAAGRLPKDVGQQVRALAKRDQNQTIAEILLGDTPIEPQDWTAAIAAVKGRVTLLDRLRSLFTRKPKPPAR